MPVELQMWVDPFHTSKSSACELRATARGGNIIYHIISRTRARRVARRMETWLEDTFAAEFIFAPSCRVSAMVSSSKFKLQIYGIGLDYHVKECVPHVRFTPLFL